MSLAAVADQPRRSSAGSTIARVDAEGRRRQPLLWSAAIVLLVMMVPTFAAFLLDGRVVNDVNVWNKPLKFEFSLALFLGTLAWFWGYLPDERRRGRFLTGFATVSVALVAYEMIYMIIQSGRGVGSHFNTATPLEGIFFILMGLAALIFTALPLPLGIAIARSPSNDLAPAFRLSVILGLILTFLLGAVAGIAISVNGGHWVGGLHTDAGGFPIFGWTRTGGDLRVAHFFGIHAMQILPVAGWLIARLRPNGRGFVWLAAGLLVLVSAYTLVEALMGRPFLGFIG